MNKVTMLILTMCILLASCTTQTDKHTETNCPKTVSPLAILNTYREDTIVNNIVMVECTGGSNAVVRVFSKDCDPKTWTLVKETEAYIGRNGYSIDKKEGDGMTPLGDYGIGKAFGIKESPKTKLSYIPVTKTTYAVDTESPYYNKIVDSAIEGPEEGEQMWDLSPDYNYGIVVDYNPECEYGKGSNIFIHCKGALPSTAGCIAVDESVMAYLLEILTPSDRIYIYPQR